MAGESEGVRTVGDSRGCHQTGESSIMKALPNGAGSCRSGALRRSLWASLCLCISLAACENGGGDGNGGAPRSDPVRGIPSAAGLRFTVTEDGALDGALSDPTRPGEQGTAPFELLSTTARGVLRLRDDGRSFSYLPNPDFSGTDGFDFALFGDRSFRATIDVTPLPDTPVLDIGGPLVAERGVFFSRQLQGSDADGEPLSYSAQGLPPWLLLDAVSGELSGTPGDDAAERVEGIAFAVVDSSSRRFDVRDVFLEVVAPSTTPRLDLAMLPASIDGRRNLRISILSPVIDLDRVTLDVALTLASEPDPTAGASIGSAVAGDGDSSVQRATDALTARIEGRELVLQAHDIESVTALELTFVLADRLGESTRRVVPLAVLPLNASGRGRTLLGRRSGRGVHVAVFGDGYREDQQTMLMADARALIDTFRSDAGVVTHLDAFNVHVVESISAEAGIDGGAYGATRDTLYQGTYDCLDVPQLICADASQLFIEAIEQYPDISQVVLFVNDTRFGGSGNNGGGVAITARDYPDIALHEMGHSLAGLADEYVDSELVNALATGFVEGDFPNVTSIANPARVPWAHWIDSDAALGELDAIDPRIGPVGVFEGALYRASSVYRPTLTSRMRQYAQPFGPVNSEQWVLGVYRAADVVRDFQPQLLSIDMNAGDTQRFSVTPYFPDDVQSVSWYFDGQRVRAADDARLFEVTPGLGTHRVRLEVGDVSGRIRIDPPHEGYFDWEWELVVQ